MHVRVLQLSRLVTATLAAATVAACGGSYNGGTEPTPSIAIALSSGTLSVTQGSNSTVSVALTRSGGFTGDVAITVDGLPTGITAAAAPATIGATSTSSVITITAAATAAPATSTLTVRATGTGVTAQTATLALVVAGGFTLSVAPTTVTAQPGSPGTATVTVTRTGTFTGQVSLSATGLPNGVTATFNPPIATGTTSTVTFTATPSATAGQGVVTIRGNATGLNEQTTPLTLTISTPGGSGNTVFEFCTASQTPLWLAIQDGANSTWTRVTPTGTKFQFNITQPKAGIAYVTAMASPGVSSTSRGLASRLSAELERALLLRNQAVRANAYAARSPANEFYLTILYGTPTELAGQGTSQCLPGAGKTVNGTVANVTSSVTSEQTASISLGPSSEVASEANTSFQLTDVPDGALDLIAGRTTTTTSGTNFSIALDKLIIRRAVNAAKNSTLPVLDFGATEAFDPAQANITIGNLGPEVGFAVTNYFTAGGSGTVGAALFSFPVPGPGPFRYYGVPTAKQIAGDLHVAIAFGLPSLANTDQSRFGALFFKDPTDRTVTLGAALTTPTVSAAAPTPYVRFRATGPIQASYNKFVAVDFIQGLDARSVSITASEGYLSGSANYDFTIPDFTAVAGWDNTWGPKAGAATDWIVTAYTFSGIGFNSAAPVEGSTFTGATRSGTITP